MQKVPCNKLFSNKIHEHSIHRGTALLVRESENRARKREIADWPRLRNWATNRHGKDSIRACDI